MNEPRTQPLRRPQSAQVFLVCAVAGEWRFLLLLRHPLPRLDLPAFWQGVTGGLEAGETFADAALREVREETSLVLPAVIDTSFSHRFAIRPEWRNAYGDGPTEVEERVYYAILPEPTVPVLSHEHQAFRWCALAEAEALLTFAATRPCLHAVARHLA